MKEEFYQVKREQKLYRICWDIYPKILKKIIIGKEEKILDAGCGNGELGKHLNIRELDGFDSDEQAVKEAQKTGMYKRVIKSSIYNLPFDNKEFDKTICIEVLEYLKEPERAFRELMRVTKNEIIVSTANFNWYKLKAIFSKRWRNQYKNQIALNETFINSRFLKNLAGKNLIKVKIFYMSNKMDSLRNLLGSWLAGEVGGVFKLK